jgi:7-cyano-7-deazaguanine tRNA-ribosyltransferase
MNLPVERPLHLFGAGHPFMFALAVALGCDLFDSASYALYAKDNRYMTETGTSRLNELDYFPCACPRCTHATPKQIRELPKEERAVFLAEHNLYVCMAEMKRIKQAIRDGRLWEHMEMRAHSHPALMQAVRKLGKYEEYVEKHNPTSKDSGLFFFDSAGLARPEVVRHRRNTAERYVKPRQARILLFMPQARTRPFHRSEEYRKAAKLLSHKLKGQFSKVHVCFYAAPFGVIPIELDEVYPLSQHEVALPLDKETIEYVANQVSDYVSRMDYEMVVLLNDSENWQKAVMRSCKKTCLDKGIAFEWVDSRVRLSKTIPAKLERVLRDKLRE